ncbi:uncharacterized protein CC84DRAFT_1173176 [Paraphaeosphaeria sporulosa]|uniref:Uncharacterized protein n=1 Tax=Paraphaeosphaeria sporulosa TaxID=1460663 RepID=A0A177CVF1_9PLEO|nr:uncharacterized protein CC84DRAFT_1173176 [Paraphaeosphaeria sporulosa]OAG10840.1 hypothetical protein CC84DRAFT_1173176 [Paraphaeosphaeria sporulosa]
MATPNDQPDMNLIVKLLEDIQRHPPAFTVKTLLAQHYVSIGWFDAAVDYIAELKREAPGDAEMKPLEEFAHATKAENGVNSGNNSRKDLVEGYRGLRQKAKGIINDLSRLQAQQRQIGTPISGLSARIQAILVGQVSSGIVTVRPAANPQLVVRAIQGNPEKGMDIVIADLQDDIYYQRAQNWSRKGNASHAENPLRAWLFMHAEHENLRRRLNVTETNYAWDLSEPVQAITANGGVMRNPLGRDMFTPKDGRRILMSPHGKPLDQIQARQPEYSQGVSPETIQRLEELADVMLGEEERDQMTSRREIGDFQAYFTTLLDRKQKTVEAFRCPAYDTHTGDAKATELCIHKAGKFTTQVAAHLMKKWGELGPPKGCVVI